MSVENVSNPVANSFVTHILATAGRLDKDDLNTKLGQLSRKIDEVKIEVHDSLNKKYAVFFPMFNSTRILVSKVDSTRQELEETIAAIEKQVKIQQQLSAGEHENLLLKWEQCTAALSILDQLIRFNDNIQSINQSISSKNFVIGAEKVKPTTDLLSELSARYDGQLKILPNLESTLMKLQNKLVDHCTDIWAETVQWSVTEMEVIDDRATQKVELRLACQKSSTRERLSDALISLLNLNCLDPIIQSFAEKLMKYFIHPIITNPGNIVIDKRSQPPFEIISIVIPSEKEESRRISQQPSKVFCHLKNVLEFFDKELSCTINFPQSDSKDHGDVGTPGSVCLTEFLGKQIGSGFVDLIVKECLARSIPTNHKDLNQYLTVISATEEFQIFLVQLKFLEASNRLMVDYVNSIERLFANKKCEDILAQARALMKAEIHNVIQVSSSSEKNDAKSAEDVAALCDAQLTPMFRFPACQISQSAHKLIEIAHSILQEAVSGFKSPSTASSEEGSPSKDNEQCAIQLFYCVRNVFEMYCNIVPLYHRESLSTIPLIAAIHHNDCMYISHHLMILGSQYRAKLPEPLSKGAATFVDYVPILRRMGAKCMIELLLQQKLQILEILRSANGFAGVGEDENLSLAERAIRQLLLKLQHLENVWKDVLPSNVFSKSIGMLFNVAIAEMSSSIIALEDISELDAHQLNTLLKSLAERGEELFQSSDKTSLYKLVPKWNRLRELSFVLTSRLQEISDRWFDGKGPLALEFNPNELKQLIRALFQNTDKRSAVLSLIK